MSVIYPGNYVAHLNAYREQGVVALPGVEFYRAVGAIVVNPDNDSITATDGSLAAGAYTPQVLSPDLRQDDKPRKDKPMVIPAGAVIYRTAVSAPGLQEATVAGTTTVEVTAPAAPVAGTPLTAAADGYFPEEGEVSVFVSILNGTPIAETTIEITTDAILVPSLKPSAGACRNSPSAIIVEVCYWLPAAAPSYDDAHIPYAIEAGQGY